MAKSKPSVDLDTGDDEDQDATQGGSFTAPLGPGQVAENCGCPDKKKGKRLRIKIKESKKKKKVLNEVRPTTELWQTKAVLVTEKSHGAGAPGLEDFRNSIRVRCGVTTVDSIGPARTEGGRVIAKLRVKFATDARPEYELRRMKSLISQIKGVRNISFIPGSLVRTETK
jgi:hypothetical protein